MNFGVLWVAALLLSLQVAAAISIDTCTNSQTCTKDLVVETCADGEGGWDCGHNTWLPDTVFNFINDGKCTRKAGNYLCGKSKVDRSLHNAALLGRCIRVCKKYDRLKACDCAQCTLDSFACSLDGETIDIEADIFHTLQSRACFIQRHTRAQMESIVCASSLGEVKTTLKTYMAATRGDCVYKCSREAPNRLDSCVLDPVPIVPDPDEDEIAVSLPKEDTNQISKLPTTKHQDIETIKAPSLPTPSLVEEAHKFLKDSAKPEGDASRPRSGGTIPEADVESTIEVPSREPSAQIIAEPNADSTGEPTEPDANSAPGPATEGDDITQADQGREPIVAEVAADTSDTLTLESASAEESGPSPGTLRVAYTTGAWEGCSVSCGVGIQKRLVSCVLMDDQDQSVSLEICRETPDLGQTPASTRRCVRPQCEEFTPIVTGTKECSNTCGPSLERRSLICSSNYGRTVSLEKCGLTMPKIGSMFGNKVTFDTTASDGACDKEVNMGVKTFVEMSQQSSIFNKRTRPGAQCENKLVVEGALVEKCEAFGCGDRVWMVTQDWSACTKTCGGGIQTREVKCFQNGQEVSGSRCPNPKPVTTKACNSGKCQDDLTYWMAGSWSDCDKSCIDKDNGETDILYGRRYRDVSCVSSLSREVLDDSACGSIRKPSSQSTCAVKHCDFCDVGEPCNGRGTCENLQCTCDDGFGGERCEYREVCEIGDDNPDCCPSTVVDDGGKCCESGAVGTDGRCCDAGQVLDRDGYCCAEALDACGECGGSAIQVDALGECCDGQVDASGICCMGLVDECGVCDGVGTSCDTELRIAVGVEPKKRGAIQRNMQGAESAILQQKVLHQLSKQLGIHESLIHVKRLLGETVGKTTGRRLLDHSEGNIDVVSSGEPVGITRSWMKNLLGAVKEIACPARMQGRISAAPWFDTSLVRIPLIRRNRRIGELEKKDPEEKRGTSAPSRVLLQAGHPTPEEPTQKPNVRSTVTIDGEAGLPFSQLHNSLMELKENVTIFTEDKVGVCGNGICELNERPVMNGDKSDGCPVDCMVPMIHPPSTEIDGRSVHCSGNGTPLFVSGTCQCFVGYSGDACEACAPSFIRRAGSKSGDFQCVRNFSPSVPRVNANIFGDLSSDRSLESGPSSGKKGDGGKKKRKSAKAGPTTLALIGFLVAIAVLGTVAAVVLFFRRKGDTDGKHNEGRRDREIPVIAQQEPDVEMGLPPKEEDEVRSRHGGLPDHLDFITPPRTNSTVSGSGDEAAISIEEATIDDSAEPHAGPHFY